jgi:hypothetical protein
MLRSATKLSEQEAIDWCTEHFWSYEGKLLKAAEEGILRVHAKARFSTYLGSNVAYTPKTLSAHTVSLRMPILEWREDWQLAHERQGIMLS